MLGATFGRVTIIKDMGTEKESGHYYRMVVGQCSCGVVKPYRLGQLTRGVAKSCGCYNREVQEKTLKKHGLTKHPLHVVWSGMIGRCYHTYYRHYHRYGGAGITVCNEWRNSFQSFYDWAISNGWKRGLQLDKDIKSEKENKVYSPETCCFVTATENMQYRTNTTYLEIDNKINSLSDWCRILNKDYSTVRNNARRMPLKEALEKTNKPNGHFIPKNKRNNL